MSLMVYIGFLVWDVVLCSVLFFTYGESGSEREGKEGGKGGGRGGMLR